MNGTPGEMLPGRRVSGMRTPNTGLPGTRLPGDVNSVTLSDPDVDGSATGVTSLGYVDDDRVIARSVTVETADPDVELNVNVDGYPIFDEPVSPETEDSETFTPNRNVSVSAGEKEVEVEVTDPGTEDVSVYVTLKGDPNN